MSARENIPYDELETGQSASFQRSIGTREIALFAAATGDLNPVHLDPGFAASTPFGEPIAHGMLTGGLVSAALATVLPGPGTIYLGQNLRFRLPVKPGDTITVTLTVTEKRDRRRWVRLNCEAHNQDGKLVANGEAEVQAPAEKMTVDLPPEPAVSLC